MPVFIWSLILFNIIMGVFALVALFCSISPMLVFIWSFILIGIIIVAFVVVALIRRQYFRTESFPDEGFTISELRQLHQSGQMSAEEFEKARAALIGQQTNKKIAPPLPSDKSPQ